MCFFTLSGKGWAGSGVVVMSGSQSIRFLKYISILLTLLLVFSCSAQITPVQTITQDSNGKTLSSSTEYKVTTYQSGVPTEAIVFKDLKSAQQKVSSYLQFENYYNYYPKGTFLFAILSQMEQDSWKLGAPETKYVTLNTLTNTQSNNQTSTSASTSTSSGTQDLINNGINPTETPYPTAVCTFLVNQANLCTEDKVTALTGIVSVAVIGGITAAVVSSVNRQATTTADEQNKKNAWQMLAATAKGAASGGPSCQCNSAIQSSPPYCTGAGMCQCGSPNCPP